MSPLGRVEVSVMTIDLFFRSFIFFIFYQKGFHLAPKSIVHRYDKRAREKITV